MQTRWCYVAGGRPKPAANINQHYSNTVRPCETQRGSSQTCTVRAPCKHPASPKRRRAQARSIRMGLRNVLLSALALSRVGATDLAEGSSWEWAGTFETTPNALYNWIAEKMVCHYAGQPERALTCSPAHAFFSLFARRNCFHRQPYEDRRAPGY